MISLSLWGEKGRMGGEIKKALRLFPEFKLSELSSDTQGVLDFTSSTGLLELLKKLDDEKSTSWVVSGSTGFDLEQRATLEACGKTRTIVWAANFSLGVLALSRLLDSAILLPELQGFVPRIRETHHTLKKDSPSGTALLLKGHLFPDTFIESIREGDVVGEHEVWFESGSERLGLIHQAQDRKVFAEGALKSAMLLTEKLKKNRNSFPKRLLGLQDVFSS